MSELHVFAASSRNAGADLDSDTEITDTESLSEFLVRAWDIIVFCIMPYKKNKQSHSSRLREMGAY